MMTLKCKRGESRQDKAFASNGKHSATLPQRRCELDKLCRLHRKHRRGAAVVEFAIVAPLFFLFVFGMIEYGRMVMVQQILTNASREGARIAVLDDVNTADVEDKVDDFLSTSSISGAETRVLVAGNEADPSTAQYGDPITVEVSISFDQVSWLPSPMYLGGQQMRASTVMRRESVQ